LKTRWNETPEYRDFIGVHFEKCIDAGKKTVPRVTTLGPRMDCWAARRGGASL
jgi:hypothetical protein